MNGTATYALLIVKDRWVSIKNHNGYRKLQNNYKPVDKRNILWYYERKILVFNSKKEFLLVNRYIKKLLFVIVFSSLVFVMTQTATTATTVSFITTTGVNLRSAPSTDANIITTVGTGTNVTLIDHDPAGWSRVRVNGTEGSISSEFLTFPSTNSPVTFRTTSGVNMRSAPNIDASVVRVINTGTDVEVISHDPAGWSNVRVNDTTGFVRSDFLMMPASGVQQGSDIPTASQTVTTLQTTSGVNFRSAPSTDANIITVLNSGTRVQVHGSIVDGWYAVHHNGEAGFISAEFLTVTAGRNVELLTMAEVAPLLRTGVDLRLTDVRTGRTFNVRPFSLGRHADVDTSSREDTDIKFNLRNGTWSWAARPVWVHIGDRTIAASINGMPHGGSVVSGNGVSGHFCLHFHGTITNNQRYQTDLRNAIAEAYSAGR